MLLFFGCFSVTSCALFSAIFLNTFTNCFNNYIFSYSVVLELVVDAYVSLLTDSKTVYYGVTIGELRYLCLKNSELEILSDLVCLLYTLVNEVKRICNVNNSW